MIGPSNKLDALLGLVEADRKITLALLRRLIQAGNNNMFQMDFLALAAGKRCVSTSAGFHRLILDFNLLCSRVLLRTHIDTALRFAAVSLVDNVDQFATDIFQGKRIDKLKDASGKQLRDKYLVEHFSLKLPWLQKVYESLSGYVHFSGSHVAASFGRFDQDGTVQLRIHADDAHFPEASWLEMVECFNETTMFFHTYLEGWVVMKGENEDRIE
jgi:hypothetical protein